MADERRANERYAVERPALVRRPDGDVEAVLTSISLGGGHVACPAAVVPGERVHVSVQARRASLPDIELHGQVVYTVRKGSVQRPGFALRWEPAPDHEPLAALVRWAANMADVRAPAGPAVRDTLRDLDAVGAAEGDQEP